MKSDGNWLFRLVPFFIVFVFLLIIGWFIFIGIIGTKAYQAIDSKGLKAVIEQIWEGK